MPFTMDDLADEKFSVETLTEGMNRVTEGQMVNTLLDPLFDEEGIDTTHVSIERDGDTLTLVPARERGAPGDVTTGEHRDAIPFKTLHLPTPSFMGADEFQNVRKTGSKTETEIVADKIAARLLKMRRRLEATLTFHRFGAVTGKIYDANGTKVLLDLFDRFGMSQQTVACALATDGTNVKQKITDAKRKAEDAIGDSGMITGFLCVAGRNFMDAFTSHPKTEKAFERYNNGEVLRSDVRGGLNFNDVTFKEYYGKVGNTYFIDPDDAYLIPIVAGLFVTKYAPANWMETVNTMGVPFYGKVWAAPDNSGINLSAQTNPLTISNNPRATIKFTK